MNCEQVQERLSGYLEGLLSPGDSQTVKSHLSSCTRCQAEAETLAQTIRAVADLSHLEPPPGFSRKVMARIREETNKPTLWQRLFLPIWIKIPVHVMALLLVSGLAIYLYQTNRPLETELKESIVLDSDPLLKKDFQESKEASKLLPSSPQEKPPIQEPSLKESKTDAIKKGRNALQGIPEQSIIVEENRALAPKLDQTAYYELSFTPKETQEGTKILAQKLEDLIKQMGGEYLQIDEKIGKRKQDLLLRPQILWLTIPEDHYDQFKTGLSSLGRIDLESKKPDSTVGGAYDTLSPLASPEKVTSTIRIKLTILLPEKPKEALPADQPVR